MAELSYTVDLTPGSSQELVWSLLVLVGGAWVITSGSVSLIQVTTVFLRPALLGLVGVALLLFWANVRGDDADELTVTVETDSQGATVSSSVGSFTHDHPDEHDHGPEGWSEGGITTHRHD